MTQPGWPTIGCDLAGRSATSAARLQVTRITLPYPQTSSFPLLSSISSSSFFVSIIIFYSYVHPSVVWPSPSYPAG
ncbi:hypothetical protein BDQ94DRAFT_25833 [Aspergillus welwitschiae]|uniref:Uncharacterized protein n=1 Tax=Aspergillus welwitschiae TaxID=1341132 RepID=A0A3F3Q4X4_9EURO|nr:hypothetical protein BDQ94DRAFT_25833 [Aspergillus welwitschiae]RDH33746.1 hypothetical protein BDQ94DRAFT_25833 [Aspergillus welwitschiae]